MPWDLTGFYPGSSLWPSPFYNPAQLEGRTHGLGSLGLHGLPSPSDELTCSARLTVRPSLAPLFTRLLEDMEVLEGRTARFDCKISGTPPPSVTWTHFGMALYPADVGGPPRAREQSPGLRLLCIPPSVHRPPRGGEREPAAPAGRGSTLAAHCPRGQ